MQADPAGSSFRDPAGFVFLHEGRPHRYVASVHAEAYDHLIRSGLYEKLAKEGHLVPHEEVDLVVPGLAPAHRVLRPEVVPFVSYPYEWCFGELQAAALLTLTIAKEALRRGMVLRDASAYNVQFRGGSPVFIDTLSFGLRRPGEPWAAYRQFCQHFLAPLALMAFRDVRLGRLLRVHLDGVPLDLAGRLLPLRARLKPGIAFHLVLHARFLRGASDSHTDASARRARAAKVTDAGLLGLLESLDSLVRSLAWRPAGTEWGDYYSDTNYSEESFAHKEQLVAAYLDAARPDSVWDLGANTGRFTRLASDRGIPSVAFDVDEAAVEKGFRETRRRRDTRLLHLVQDLSNPSGALGWAHEERMSLEERGPAGCVLALGLIHHLAIGNNVPLERVASFLARLGRTAVVEFIPKTDSQVVRLLASREDVFEGYRQDAFEEAVARHFEIRKREAVRASERCLYLLVRRSATP